MLQNSGYYTLVEATGTSLGSNSVNTLEDIFVLGSGLELVVDELGLKSFLRSHNRKSFTETGSQTAHEGVHLASASEHVGLCEFVGTETDGVLGHREQKKSSVAFVEAEESLVTESFLGQTSHAKLELCFINLKHSLQVLSWICARDLNSANNTADKA